MRDRPVFNTKYRNINFGTRFIRRENSEQNDSPTRRFDNHPPHYVTYESRYKMIVETSASNVNDNISNSSISINSNKQLVSGSPETIPNASDREEDNVSQTSSISCDDDNNTSPRLQNLTPPRPHIPDDMVDSNQQEDRLGKRTLSETISSNIHTINSVKFQCQ